MTSNIMQLVVIPLNQPSRAEDGEDLILRCVESSGIQAGVTLDLRFANRQWTGRFRPFEIKSLRMNQITGDIK